MNHWLSEGDISNRTSYTQHIPNIYILNGYPIPSSAQQELPELSRLAVPLPSYRNASRGRRCVKLGSYLAHKDQRFPELCLADGTDVPCLTALLAGGTGPVGLLGTMGGKNNTVKRFQDDLVCAENARSAFHTQISCKTREGKWCCSTVCGEERFGNQHAEPGQPGIPCSALSPPRADSIF